jgi:ribosomal protein S18 acetylase RimI-like enzyme
MQAFTLRPAVLEDEPFLWQMLFEAAHMGEEGHTAVQATQNRPELARYMQGWGRTGDLGAIAVINDAMPIGAAWVRLLRGEARGYAYVDDDTPELAIGIHPAYRGNGVGAAVLAYLIHLAEGRYPAISLSTRATNLPAVRLYERVGFKKIEGSDVINRAGGLSYTMKLSLCTLLV